jgi:hypothetical protein
MVVVTPAWHLAARPAADFGISVLEVPGGNDDRSSFAAESDRAWVPVERRKRTLDVVDSCRRGIQACVGDGPLIRSIAGCQADHRDNSII